MTMTKIFITIKLFDYYQVFLVAGGCCSLSSTETLIEGGQAWTFQNPLPSRRSGLRGISLPDTVIMTGRNILIICTLKLNVITSMILIES